MKASIEIHRQRPGHVQFNLRFQPGSAGQTPMGQFLTLESVALRDKLQAFDASAPQGDASLADTDVEPAGPTEVELLNAKVVEMNAQHSQALRVETERADAAERRLTEYETREAARVREAQELAELTGGASTSTGATKSAARGKSTAKVDPVRVDTTDTAKIDNADSVAA